MQRATWGSSSVSGGSLDWLGGGPRLMPMHPVTPAVVRFTLPARPGDAQTTAISTLLPRGAVTRVTGTPSDLGVAVTTAPTPAPIGALLEPEGVPHPVRELAEPPRGRAPPPNPQTDLTTTHALPVGTGAASLSLLHGNTFPRCQPFFRAGWGWRPCWVRGSSAGELLVEPEDDVVEGL